MRDITEALPIICTVFELTSCVPSSPPSKGDNREYTDQLSHYLVQELFRFRPQNSTPVLYNAAIGHFYYHETLLCCNIAATLLFIQSMVYRHPPTHTTLFCCPVYLLLFFSLLTYLVWLCICSPLYNAIVLLCCTMVLEKSKISFQCVQAG